MGHLCRLFGPEAVVESVVLPDDEDALALSLKMLLLRAANAADQLVGEFDLIHFAPVDDKMQEMVGLLTDILPSVKEAAG